MEIYGDTEGGKIHKGLATNEKRQLREDNSKRAIHIFRKKTESGCRQGGKKIYLGGKDHHRGGEEGRAAIHAARITLLIEAGEFLTNQV